MKNEVVVVSNPKSSVTEAIKNIRTNLQFSSVDKEVKTILVTSSIAGEGKSYISANLAVAFAQADKKVLIVDCDLRRGRVNKIFDLDNDKGLSNILIDKVKENYKKYIKKTKYKNIFVITSGVFPPNPSELLSSDKNKELNEILRKEFDIVIYDCTPVGGLADAIVMSDIVDKIVVVTRYKKTPMELLKNTIRQLEVNKDKIAGIIINKYPVKANKYYSKYYQ